ncbi:MAG: argininosuccinate synthase [Verrucomicrobia bacterium]|nr:MAG: argininosuccinate synthase [Verrucomicrobiota bacterium]
MKIVLAYSGGLDTSVILRWLRQNYDAQIIAFCADIGQEEELEGLAEKARQTGAMKCIIEDLREEFARDFVFPMFRAGAIYEGQYFLGTSIARPLIAKQMVEIALAEGADAIAHGATGKGNDQVRFELTAAALAPDLRVIAPWREERFRKQFPGRAEMIAFAEANNIPVAASAAKPYSMDRNLLHISFESGMLEDPWFDASGPGARDMYKLTVSPEDAPDTPEYMELEFHQGNSVAGMKGRGVYETPGGTILHFAHRQLETLTMDREVMQLRDSLIPKYSALVYNGFWFSPEREALQALVTETQRDVTGLVRLKLYKGNIIVAGRKSPKSLYDAKIATMENSTSSYDQGDATGFIRLNALRLKLRATIHSKTESR